MLDASGLPWLLQPVRNNGETNPGTVLFFVALAVAGFYGFHVVPIHFDNLEVKEASVEAFNAWFSKGEKAAQDGLVMRLNEKNPDVTHFEVAEDGSTSLKPGFGITPEQVSFVFDEDKKILTVRVAYDRVVEFKPLKKRKTFHLVAEKTGKELK